MSLSRWRLPVSARLPSEWIPSAIRRAPHRIYHRMPMSSSKRIDYLDGWRGLAILVVLVAHFGHLESTNLGLFGVELFFVLSGLLMARILYEQRMPIGEFYRRRIARIFPLFYLFVFTILFIEWARGA